MVRLKNARAPSCGGCAFAARIFSSPRLPAVGRRSFLRRLWCFWRSNRLARHTPSKHLQEILPPSGRLQLQTHRRGYWDVVPACLFISFHLSLTALRESEPTDGSCDAQPYCG